MNYVVITHRTKDRVETRLKISLNKKVRVEIIFSGSEKPNDECIMKYLVIANRMLEDGEAK
jgi:hypothetical protein